MPDWSEQFKALLSSPLGEELLRELENLRQSQLERAEDEDEKDKSFGFTKKAAGVRLTIGHLKSLATVLPEEEGGKSPNQ